MPYSTPDLITSSSKIIIIIITNKLKITTELKLFIREKQGITCRIYAAFARRTARCRRHQPHWQADRWRASAPEARGCRRRPRRNRPQCCGKSLGGRGCRWGGALARPIGAPPRPRCRFAWTNSTLRTNSPSNSTSRLCRRRSSSKP